MEQNIDASDAAITQQNVVASDATIGTLDAGIVQQNVSASDAAIAQHTRDCRY